MQDLLDENTSSHKNTLQFHWWVLLIWFFFFFVGHVFRIMHWPFGAILMVLGAGGFIAYSLASLVLIKRKTPLLIISNALGLLWILVILWSIFFNNGHPLNVSGLFVQLIALTVLFVIHWGILYLIKKGRLKKNS